MLLPLVLLIIYQIVHVFLPQGQIILETPMVRKVNK